MEATSTEKMQYKARFLMGQAVLRISGFAAALVAIVLMTTNKETIDFFGIELDAKYNYSPAFKFYVAANSVACFLSLVSMSCTLYHARVAGSCRRTYYIVFLLDLMAMMCIVIGSSAATAIAYVGRHGNSHAGWMQICDHFGKFCNKVLASLLVSFAAAIIFTVLTIWSSWKATQEAPVPISETEKNFKKKENKIGSDCASPI